MRSGMTLDAIAVQALRGAGQRRPGRGRSTRRRTGSSSRSMRAPGGMLPPGRKYTGAATSAVTLSPDGDTLYAVNSGANSIAVIPLNGREAHSVSGLIPDRLRAARHHLQRRRLVDVHRERQERHRSRTPAIWRAARPASPASCIRAATPRPPPRRGRRISTSSSWNGRRWSAPGAGRAII